MARGDGAGGADQRDSLRAAGEGAGSAVPLSRFARAAEPGRVALSPAVSGEVPRLRVASANLFSGGADPRALCEMFDAMGADVVCLQEAAPRNFDALAQSFPHGVLGFAPDASALGVLSRRPVTFGKVALTWRDAEVATLAPEHWPELGQPLDVINIHISAPHVHKPPLYGLVIRYKQVRALEDHLRAALADDHPGQPRSTLLLGDCNATPLWPAYRRIAAQLTDAAITVAQRRGRPVEPTWAPAPKSRRRLRLDHAFTRGVTATDFHVAPIVGSDHSAIIVDIAEFRSRPGS